MLDLEEAVPPEAKCQVFTPTTNEVEWANQVLTSFQAAGGEAVQLPSGEFVDLPVAERARRLLQIAASPTEQAPAATVPAGP